MKKARARGVTDIKILVEENALNDKQFKDLLKEYSAISEIKCRDQVFGNCVVIDEGEDAFIILTQRFFKKLSYFGVITDHIAFGPGSNYYFDYLYRTAEIVKFK